MDSVAQPSAAVAPITGVQALAATDMRRVDNLIRARLASDIVLVNHVAEHIIGSGGKRLRPMLHVLAARAAGYAGDDHIQLAAVIEFIHTATLLHDDVVDESGLRRGRETANALWGNAPSVLVGDFLYSRAFQLMVELDRMRVMRILADTTNRIAEGEVLQLLTIHNPDTTEAACLDVIERKTAVLFSAATRLGAVLAGLPPEQEEALARYGMDLGFAFQIADDVLDYVSDAETLGKNIGDDLAQGKATLPIILAIAASPPEAADTLRRALKSGEIGAFDAIIGAIRASGAIDAARSRALSHANAARDALTALPASSERDALAALADHAVTRST